MLLLLVTMTTLTSPFLSSNQYPGYSDSRDYASRSSDVAESDDYFDDAVDSWDGFGGGGGEGGGEDDEIFGGGRGDGGNFGGRSSENFRGGRGIGSFGGDEEDDSVGSPQHGDYRSYHSSSSIIRERDKGYDPYYYYSPKASRQAAVMMAAANPRIGVRSSLVGAGDTCHVDPVMMSISPPRKYAHLCQPTTEISYGCRGGCASYSRVDTRNMTNVLRSCSCCRPSGFGFRLIKLQCSNFALRTTVKFALGCHCRPCMASVDAVGIQRLRDLLRQASLTNIG